jgi:hypothetical protein
MGDPLRTHEAAASAVDAVERRRDEPIGLAPPPPPPPPPSPPPPPPHLSGERPTSRALPALAGAAFALLAAGAVTTWLVLRGAPPVAEAQLERKPRRAEPSAKKPAPPAPCAEGDLDECTARCRDGSGPSCTRLGEIDERGERATRDLALAVEAYAKACERDDAKGCSRLGGLYLTGKGTRYDYAAGTRVIRRACTLGYTFSCGWLAWKGEGEAKDLAKAERLFGKACEGEDVRACTWQGEMHENGEGMAPDRPGARRLFQRGCDGGEQFSCWRLGQILLRTTGSATDARDGAELIEKACAADVEGACADLRAFGRGAAKP